MKSIRNRIITFLLITLSPLAGAEALSDYKRVAGLSGNLTSIGSDTLASMMSIWSEKFSAYYPNVNIQVQASGSSTATPALTEGTAQFGPMSRPMRIKELEAFEREHGYRPVELKVAIDAIGLFVHKNNPVKGMDFKQIDSVFSNTMRCGANFATDSWNSLGVEGNWAKRRIQLFGRNSVSGTYGYFKKTALCGGDFKPYVNELPGSASVVQAVASSINAIGYSGVGYQVSGVKVLPVSREGEEYVAPTKENILSGEYPLSRFLYVYVNKHPAKPMSQIEREFVRFIFSEEGQEIVEKEGYLPISPDLAAEELKKVGL